MCCMLRCVYCVLRRLARLQHMRRWLAVVHVACRGTRTRRSTSRRACMWRPALSRLLVGADRPPPSDSPGLASRLCGPLYALAHQGPTRGRRPNLTPTSPPTTPSGPCRDLHPGTGHLHRSQLDRQPWRVGAFTLSTTQLAAECVFVACLSLLWPLRACLDRSTSPSLPPVRVLPRCRRHAFRICNNVNPSEPCFG